VSWYYAGQFTQAESGFFAIMSEAEMSFTTESSGYEKTILSDLQGAWTLLRESVVETGGFDGMDRVLFHIDEAMSWESVRNLGRMPPLLLIIRNLCLQGGAPAEVMENIQQVHDTLEEVLLEYPSGS
jgi:hypothetical protein